MKREWKSPNLEVLNVGMTMAGPGIRFADLEQSDPDEVVNHS